MDEINTKQIQGLYLRYKALIWPVGTSLAALIILTLVIIPQLMGYLNIQSKILQINQRSGTLDVKAEELEKLDSADIDKNFKTTFQILPGEQDVPTALVTIQGLVSRSGLILRNISYAGGSKSNNKNSFQFSLTVAGSLNSVRDFMIKLRDAPRIFQVESLSLRFLRSSSLVEAEIPVAVYFEPAPRTIGSLDQPVPRLSDKEEQLLSQLSGIVLRSDVFIEEQASASGVPIGKTNPFE